MKKLFVFMLGLGVMAISAQAGVDANGNKTVETTTEEEPELTNWVTFAVGNIWVDGDAPAFQHRYWTSEGLFGGIADLHWEPAISKNVTLEIDGHALGGTED